MTDPWDDLAREAARKKDGRRVLVPVIGAGFNAQAGHGKGWAALLADIDRLENLDLEIPTDAEVIGNTTLVWEAMLLELAPKTDEVPQRVEHALQRTVAAVLDRTYTVGGVTSALAARFLGAGFSDVVSFNFDRGLHLVEPSWSRKGRFDPIHSHATLGDGTRVWYPHGATKDPRSIQLGMRRYGVLIEALEQARKECKAMANALAASMFPRAARTLTRGQLERLWWAHRNVAQSWVSTAMNAPLLFIGLGMGREEWPLWWFLNQRARNHARRRLRTPVFVFIRKEEEKRLRTAARLCGITLLVFDEFAAGWRRLFRALGI